MPHRCVFKVASESTEISIVGGRFDVEAFHWSQLASGIKKNQLLLKGCTGKLPVSVVLRALYRQAKEPRRTTQAMRDRAKSVFQALVSGIAFRAEASRFHKHWTDNIITQPQLSPACARGAENKWSRQRNNSKRGAPVSGFLKREISKRVVRMIGKSKAKKTVKMSSRQFAAGVALGMGCEDDSAESRALAQAAKGAEIYSQWQYFLGMRRVGNRCKHLGIAVDGVDAPSRGHVLTFACGDMATGEHWWAPPLDFAYSCFVCCFLPVSGSFDIALDAGGQPTHK